MEFLLFLSHLHTGNLVILSSYWSTHTILILELTLWNLQISAKELPRWQTVVVYENATNSDVGAVIVLCHLVAAASNETSAVLVTSAYWEPVIWNSKLCRSLESRLSIVDKRKLPGWDIWDAFLNHHLTVYPSKQLYSSTYLGLLIPLNHMFTYQGSSGTGSTKCRPNIGTIWQAQRFRIKPKWRTKV